MSFQTFMNFFLTKQSWIFDKYTFLFYKNVLV